MRLKEGATLLISVAAAQLYVYMTLEKKLKLSC